MIGLVLAAGAGRRLRPHTDALPKALLPVDGDTTILDIALRNLARVDLREVVVVVGYAADLVEQRKEALEKRHGVQLTLIHNARAELCNNAYSLWLAREQLLEGALMLNGDIVHPVSVEQTLLSARGPGILLAVDTDKHLADEEMKVLVDAARGLTNICKTMEPAAAYGEYIGANIIESWAAAELADALQSTFERDPDLYYEDAFQEYVDRGGFIGTASIGAKVPWVEVDDHRDLARAHEIACYY